MEEQSPYKTARQTPAIDPRELRIGNLVCCHGRPVIIDSIVHDGINYSYPDEEPEYQFDNIQPIPLTEEILIKAGFKQNQMDGDEFYYSCDLKDDVYCDLSLINGDKSGYLEAILFPYESWFRYRYVHQLQNLYFALTGKELKIKL